MPKRTFVQLAVSLLSLSVSCSTPVRPGDDAGRADAGRDILPPGTLGGCTTDEDCVADFDGTEWPYVNPETLRCKRDVDTGLGFCSECDSASDCPGKHVCHLGVFCYDQDREGVGGDCRVNEDCQPNTGRWSPLHPVECRPFSWAPIDPEDPYPTDQSAEFPMFCAQCVVDEECSPGGHCIAAGFYSCVEPCEADDDCPDDWVCSDGDTCVVNRP